MPIRLLTPADAHAYIAIRREMLVEAPWAFASSPEDDSALDPAAIAEAYWQLHLQPRSAWTQELDLRPWVEKF